MLFFKIFFQKYIRCHTLSGVQTPEAFQENLVLLIPLDDSAQALPFPPGHIEVPHVAIAENNAVDLLMIKILRSHNLVPLHD
jgi:hypothetical protein